MWVEDSSEAAAAGEAMVLKSCRFCDCAGDNNLKCEVHWESLGGLSSHNTKWLYHSVGLSVVCLLFLRKDLPHPSLTYNVDGEGWLICCDVLLSAAPSRLITCTISMTTSSEPGCSRILPVIEARIHFVF